eukprot:808392-Karenia_brevis.AAC.1
MIKKSSSTRKGYSSEETTRRPATLETRCSGHSQTVSKRTVLEKCCDKAKVVQEKSRQAKAKATKPQPTSKTIRARTTTF